jgi:glycosyltransferase involved in cell wall biosynthesis
MAKLRVSVVIPAYNEAVTIGGVLSQCKPFCDEIIVIDDGSTDDTAEIAKKHGSRLIRHAKNLGVTKAVQEGIQVARGDVIVTMDADGQHNPLDLPKMIKPIVEGKADLTLGVRAEIPHCSERVINRLANLRIECSDVGTGFRAIGADLAKRMKLHGTCLCGTLVLEADKRGARIMEISVEMKPRSHGERRMRTRHIRQFFYVLADVVF